MTRKTEARQVTSQRSFKVTKCDNCDKEVANEVVPQQFYSNGGALAGYTVNAMTLGVCDHLGDLPNGWTRAFRGNNAVSKDFCPSCSGWMGL